MYVIFKKAGGKCNIYQYYSIYKSFVTTLFKICSCASLSSILMINLSIIVHSNVSTKKCICFFGCHLVPVTNLNIIL